MGFLSLTISLVVQMHLLVATKQQLLMTVLVDDLVTINLSIHLVTDGAGNVYIRWCFGAIAGMSMELCLPAGCYTGEITYDAWPEEILVCCCKWH